MKSCRLKYIQNLEKSDLICQEYSHIFLKIYKNMVSKMIQIIETLMMKSMCWIYGHETMFGGAGRNEEGLSITNHLLKLLKYEMLTWNFFSLML